MSNDLSLLKKNLEATLQIVQDLNTLADNLIEVNAKAEAADAKANRALELIGGGPSEYSLVVWCGLQGQKVTKAWAAREGHVCRDISDYLGYPPSRKVCNGIDHPAWLWPFEVIREWWPDCCARHGWTETWHRG